MPINGVRVKCGNREHNRRLPPVFDAPALKVVQNLSSCCPL
jgi:hypothetical protein